MLQKVLCAVTILGLSVGLAAAENVKGKITKIDDKKVTVVTGKKDAKETKEYDLDKDCKFSKTENGTKTELTGGLKSDTLQNLGKKGVFATVTITDNKVTEVTIGGGKKKKKTANN